MLRRNCKQKYQAPDEIDWVLIIWIYMIIYLGSFTTHRMRQVPGCVLADLDILLGKNGQQNLPGAGAIKIIDDVQQAVG